MGLDDDCDLAILSPEQDAMVRRELESGEKLVWIGRPSPRRRAMDSIPLSILGLLFGGFAAFVAVMVAKGSIDWFPALWSLPFALGGLAMMVSPIWAYRGAFGTVYALTDRRAIALEAGLRGRIDLWSFEVHDLGSTFRVEHPDGSGDLILEERITPDNEGSRQVERRGFLAIADVREVHTLLRLHLLKEG